MFFHLSRKRPVSSARRKRRPSLESLEGRQLMSVGPEAFGTVNTTTRNNQFGSANATSANGSSVVAWVDVFNDGVNSQLDLDIRAQRYNSSGAKTGPEIIVAFTSLVEESPSVAINDSGQFVVSYTQFTAGNNDSNVLAQRFDSGGNAVGGPIQVGAGTFFERQSHVAMDRAGNFVVSYTRDTNNNNPDVFAKQYNSGGQLLRVIDVAISTSVAEADSSVAMTPDGRFDVAWEQTFTPTDDDIYLKRYSASGGLLGTNTVAFSTADDLFPSVAMDNAGNAVVAWNKGDDIKARRISSSGAQGPEINIAVTSAGEEEASVALKPGGGGFVVGYLFFPGSANIDYRVAEVSAFDTVTTLVAGRGDGAVSIDASGNYLVTYAATDAGGDTNIHSRRGRLLV